MTLLENWRNLAYGDGLDDKKREELWSGYFAIEKGIYEQILSNPAEVVEGTVKELAEKYGTEVLIMTGFLDGINESLKGYENQIETFAMLSFSASLLSFNNSSTLLIIQSAPFPKVIVKCYLLNPL